MRKLPRNCAFDPPDFPTRITARIVIQFEHVLIDTRAFQHHPGAHTGPWREEHIIPQYNRAGVKKLAFLLPAGTAPEAEPIPEGQALFPTGYFDTREQIDRWFTS